MPDVCPLLGRPTTAEPTPYADGDYRLVRCRETGFVYLQNPPDYESVRDDFPWEVTVEQERVRRHQAEPVLSAVSDATKQLKRQFLSKRNRLHALAARAIAAIPKSRPLTLLDIGCGCGGLAVDCCDRFQTAGRTVTPVGIELSETLAEGAGRRFAERGGRVIAQAALHGVEQLEDASIDIALMASFLEHDPRPLDLLNALRPKLSAGSCVVIKVPNFDCLNRRVRGGRWCGFRFPDHVNYFTPTTLRRLAQEAGYATDRGTWADHAPLSDNMYAVLRPIS